MLMMNKHFWTKFWKKEDGIGTLEIMLIIAVVVIIFIIFRDFIIETINKIVRNAQSNIDDYTNIENGVKEGKKE